MNRQEREQELFQWSYTDTGKIRIKALWNKVNGVPEGQDRLDSLGASVRSEMIPDILNHEFPNG